MVSREEFPRQVKLGRRAVGWLANDVDEWIRSKVDSSSSGTDHDTA